MNSVSRRLLLLFPVTLTLVVGLLISLSAFAQAVPGRVVASAKSGVEVQIAVHSSWTGSCQQRARVVVVLTNPPKNGEVSMRPVETGKPPGCAWSVSGTGVFYKSKAGFNGEDTMAIDVDFKSGFIRHYDYKITVR